MRQMLDFQLLNGRYPQFREMAAILGIKSTNGVNDHYVALRRKGWLEEGHHIRPTEGALERLLGPRCPHCNGGRLPAAAGRLKVVS